MSKNVHRIGMKLGLYSLTFSTGGIMHGMFSLDFTVYMTLNLSTFRKISVSLNEFNELSFHF